MVRQPLYPDPAGGPVRPPRKRRTRRSTGFVLALLAASLWMLGGACAQQRFRADDWVIECDGSPGGAGPECSLTVPFWQTGDQGKGSFALVIMLQTGNIGIVGQPPPTRAMMRVDKNPPIECRQARYCLFPPAASLGVVKELQGASLILIDVFTEKSQFHFSVSPKGYQAGLAQIRAWGYRQVAD